MEQGSQLSPYVTSTGQYPPCALRFRRSSGGRPRHWRCRSATRSLHWHIHLSKKTENGRKTVNYLGRYLKKPPISGSRLAHYTSGATLSFTYLDHRTQTYQQETLSQADMLRRVVQHIPEKHFRMIRYFGFLANRVCGQYLPKVYEALKMATPGPTPKLYFAQMAKAFLNVDPFRCVLCGARMVYTAAISGLTVQGLVLNAQAIAQMRYVKP
ncbi:hypothetical protein ALP64_202484 [Pseudomonas syringae pv. actinidiae]|nr:hypothetical protein ALP64_202484 [Pseudomonas syringae pv. actinidiae]